MAEPKHLDSLSTDQSKPEGLRGTGQKPLCIDLFCGLGGWAEGFLAEGYDVIGFDIERHRYPKRVINLDGEGSKSMAGKDRHGNTLMNRALEQVHGFHKAPIIEGEWDEYPGELVLQDVLTLHGSQFKDAAVIVASPPCQAYSYRAMPWKRAKALPPPDNTLFEACFRIQREASEAAGHHIPLIVENVRGAQKWVRRAPWNFGSFYLWGDVPALMPFRTAAQKFNPDGTNHGTGSWFKIADSKNRGASVHELLAARVGDGSMKGLGGGWFDKPYKERGDITGRFNSKSSARKAASAQIAKIPFPLANHIARVFKPVSGATDPAMRSLASQQELGEGSQAVPLFGFSGVSPQEPKDGTQGGLS